MTGNNIDPFENKLQSYENKAPETVIEAAVYVTDTLHLAQAAAQSVFNEQATPEHALKILELFLLEAKRRNTELVADYQNRLKPPPGNDN